MKSEITFKKIHYILMLDDSSSMRGKPWENLIEAVEKFIRLLVEDEN